MENRWKVQLYESLSGDSPVKDFIESLEQKAQTKIYSALELLQTFGIQTGLPHVKKLTGTPLWELRILGEDSLRIFYVTTSGKIFVILHGFKKKKQKTDIREIKTALNRLSEYRSRHMDS